MPINGPVEPASSMLCFTSSHHVCNSVETFVTCMCYRLTAQLARTEDAAKRALLAGNGGGGRVTQSTEASGASSGRLAARLLDAERAVSRLSLQRGQMQRSLTM